MERRYTTERANHLPALILGFFHAWSSSPRLTLEVFIRKNFGHRYFNLGSVLKVAIILAMIPQVLYYLMHDSETRRYGKSIWEIYWAWYAFIVAFIIVSFFRWIETRKLSKDDSYPYNHIGQIHPWFYKINIFGKPTEKLITCVYEPIFLFLFGFILFAISGQFIGLIIVVNSIFYSLGNYAEYWFAKQHKLNVKYGYQQAELERQLHHGEDILKMKKGNNNGDPNSSQNRNKDDTVTMAL